MIAWLFVVAGAIMAGLATAVAAGASMLAREEMAKWISQRLRGAAVQSAMLSRQGRTLGTAHTLTALGVLLQAFGISSILHSLDPVSLTAAVLLIVVPLAVTLVYSVPKAVGVLRPAELIRTTAPSIRFLSRLLAPLSPEPRAGGHAFGGPGDGTNDPLADVNLADRIVEFTERPVKDVMTRRTDVVAVPEGSTLETVARLFAESGYSRLPVFRENLDNIIGFVYAFDLLKLAPGGELMVRPVTAVPESKPCADLLWEMQGGQIQFAVILDEYGGTSGIVTLQDLLDELVEEIFGTNGTPATSDAPNGYVELAGSTPLAEIDGRFGIALDDRAETIGGLLTRALNRIPESGERIRLLGLEFDILESSQTRVERVAVHKGPVRETDLPDSVLAVGDDKEPR